MTGKEHSEFFNLVHSALKEGVEALEAGQKLTMREVVIAPAPVPMTAAQIAGLRTKKLRVSQRVFAGLLNASPATVHAWEQGRKRPSRIALRLLRLIEAHPETVLPEGWPEDDSLMHSRTG